MACKSFIPMDPYRILFPLGTLAALAGTATWIRFGFSGTGDYPGLSHPFVMIAVFLLAFITGFLMTAIPQFTGSAKCRPWELGVAALLIVLLFLSSLGETGPGALSYALTASAILALSVYCLRRFLTRTYSPPRFFIFVGLGLLMGLTGSLHLMAANLGWVEETPLLGKLLFFQGMTLSLIAGVGTHLLPAIWGWSDLPIQITKLDARESRLKTLGPAALLALLLAGSYVLEAMIVPVHGRALRALLVTVLAIWNWKILKKPKTRGKLAFWLWISAWSLLLGLWMPVLLPEYSIHGLHLAFIGGFGLMTLMIASRVTLAHGGYGFRTEVRSKLLSTASILILIAAATRFAAAFTPRAYLHHLAYAAIVWILGVLLWSFALVPKMARIRPD